MRKLTPLEQQLRHCFGRVVYSHKTQEREADACAATLRRFKLGQIVVSAIVTSGAVAVILGDSMPFKVVTAAFSLIALFISAYMKGFDPGGAAQKHHSTAASLWSIRESYLSLLTDLRTHRIREEDAMNRRDELQARLAIVYKNAPRTGPNAYADASDALKTREDYTFRDAEIDAFLPDSLQSPRHDTPT